MDPLSIVMALASYAPQITKWVTGNDKAEEVAKVVMDVATKVTGTSAGSQAIERLAVDPDSVLRFQTALADRQADLEKAYLADVNSARNREVAITTSEFAPLLNKIIVPVLALIVVIGGGLMLYYSENADVRTAASNLVMLVLGYFFGTSLGSRKANDALHDIATK